MEKEFEETNKILKGKKINNWKNRKLHHLKKKNNYSKYYQV